MLTQPPVYDGPKRPVNPEPSVPEPQEPRRERKYIPVAADLLKAAAEHFQWSPQQPANDIEFKRAYARVASAAGLTREQAVRVYAFETGGNGNPCLAVGFPGLARDLDRDRLQPVAHHQHRRTAGRTGTRASSAR